ncbi:MAG TPA: VWA domain-containing protein [Thermoanaerobaculia bacterium]|nr:VWA domain-containing protein [Thermoanaerobaculia bacterium]
MRDNRAVYAAVLAVISLPLLAQTPYLEKIEVRVTNVDVVVTDRAGKPVVGLTRDDFLVLEDGKAQPISNFYEMRAQQGDIAAAGPTAQAEVPEERRRRRFVFFLDSFSLGLERTGVLSSMRHFVESQMQPADEATVVTWNRRMEIITPFTSDKAAVLRAFDVLSKRTPSGASLKTEQYRIMNTAMEDYRNTIARRSPRQTQADTSLPAKAVMDKLTSYATIWAEEVRNEQRALFQSMHLMLTSLGGIEGRKVMVFAGSYLPERPGIEIFQQLAGAVPNFELFAGSAVNRLKPQSDEIARIARHANAVGVTMYTMYPESVDNDPGAEGREFVATASSATALATLAQVTGGTMVAKTWNFDTALQSVTSDLSAYYSIGYRSDRDDKPGEHSVVVKAKNGAYRVRSRKSYVVRSADEQVGDSVIANLVHPVSSGNIPVTLKIGVPEPDGRGTFKVMLDISFPSSGITALPDGDKVSGGFTIYIAAGTPVGSLSPVARRSEALRVPPETYKAMVAQQYPLVLHSQVLIGKGENILSVGVVDQLTNTSGFARTKVFAE